MGKIRKQYDTDSTVIALQPLLLITDRLLASYVPLFCRVPAKQKFHQFKQRRNWEFSGFPFFAAAAC
jgi:hypothetical protein